MYKRQSYQPANIKRVSMSRDNHVQVGENISDDLHTDRSMMTSAVTPANNDVIPIVQRVLRNIIDDRPIQCNDGSNETTESVHAKIIANRDTLTNFDTIINEFNDDSCVFVNELSSLKYIGVAISCDNNYEVVRPVSALCDSGAEMCAVKSAVVEDFSPNVVGQVQLRPFCGDRQI